MGRAPRTVTWDIPELTTVKHKILRGYLESWLPDVLQRHERIYMIDGFCGPGEYTGGEPGSPLIALDVIHRNIAADPELLRKIRLVCIDEDEHRCNYLYDLLQRRRCGLPALAGFEPVIEWGACVRKLKIWLTSLEKWYSVLPPMFVSLDPFGFSDIPMALISCIMQHPHSEILLSFMYEPLNRFLTHPKESIQLHVTNLLGTEQWRTIDLHKERERQICQIYRRQLCTVGNASYVCMFRLKHKRNGASYFLVFCTHRRESIERMKDVFWQIDPIFGSTYSAYKPKKDAGKQVLMPSEPDYTKLTKQLLSTFQGSTTTLQALEEYILMETAYHKTEYREHVLRRLECSSRVAVTSLNPDRKPGEYMETDLIHFMQA